MNNLAQLAFDYLWHLMFTEEDYLELDLSVDLLSGLADNLSAMSGAEKSALAQVAKDTQARLLAPPDEHGYSPRSRVTPEQKRFLEELISGSFFTQFE